MCIHRLTFAASVEREFNVICIYALLFIDYSSNLQVYWQTSYTTLTSTTNVLVYFPNACTVVVVVIFQKIHSGYDSRSTWMWNDREITIKKQHQLLAAAQ